MVLRPSLLVNDRNELIGLIEQHIRSEGPHCDLNHLDVSEVSDMSYVFEHSSFQGDISRWDVSNVTTMRSMFCSSKFNGNISKWDTSKVKDFTGMFQESVFNAPIGTWNLSNAETLRSMFEHSAFNQDISQWNTAGVRDMKYLFAHCPFQGDIKNWDLSSLQTWHDAFLAYHDSPLGYHDSPLGYLCMVENKKYPYFLLEDEYFMYALQCAQHLELSSFDTALYLYHHQQPLQSIVSLEDFTIPDA